MMKNKKCCKGGILLKLIVILSIVTSQTFAFVTPTSTTVTMPSSSLLFQQKQQQYRTSSLQMWGKNDDEIPTSERIKSCIPYLLPIFDGDQFGKYIYLRFPPLGFLDELCIKPVADKMHDIPFLGLAIFLLLSLGTLQNFDMSRNVRFNTQQAILIDILLILPEFIGEGLVDADIPRYLAEPASNFVWYVYMSMVLYSVVFNLRGKKPDGIPYVSGYADALTGPM
mmetsp:Transcript_29811/g.43387  ORF Transcript_29811/g.43387 Transcript_29811/m.43387 type:complete len:225 (-) Transcript_29811:339-1013(-)